MRDRLSLVQRELGDRFHVEKEIARGGAAWVFLAHDADGKRIALKILNPKLAMTVTGKRFLKEVAFLRRINHQHIARFLDFGQSELLVYYVMELVNGPTLRRHVTLHERLSIEDTTRVAHDLLGALEYAHGLEIVHRDVKPENIVLADWGPVLLDFGIARAVAESGTDRLTRSGFVVGTSAYMSPEQVEGAEDLDQRSDIYSLGCVLFECLAGRPPFKAKREELVLKMHLEETAPDVRTFREDTPPGFAEVLAKMLARQRDARWDSAAEVRDALTAAGA